MLYEVAGLNANMMHVKKAIWIIDGKYGIGIDVDKSLEESRDGLDSKPKEASDVDVDFHDEGFGDEEITLLKEEKNVVKGRKRKV